MIRFWLFVDHILNLKFTRCFSSLICYLKLSATKKTSSLWYCTRSSHVSKKDSLRTRLKNLRIEIDFRTLIWLKECMTTLDSLFCTSLQSWLEFFLMWSTKIFKPLLLPEYIKWERTTMTYMWYSRNMRHFITENRIELNAIWIIFSDPYKRVWDNRFFNSFLIANKYWVLVSTSLVWTIFR